MFFLHRKLSTALLCMALVLFIFDAACTLIAIDTFGPGIELNPLLYQTYMHWGTMGFIVVKTLLSLLIIPVWWVTHKNRFALFCMLLVIVVYSGIAISHIYQYLQM